MRTRTRLGLALVTFLGACTASPTEIASSITGSWALVEVIPGNGLAMTIAAHGSTLSGTGTFAGEAGPSGTVQLTGAVAGVTISLDFVLRTVWPSPGRIGE